MPNKKHLIVPDHRSKGKKSEATTTTTKKEPQKDLSLTFKANKLNCFKVGVSPVPGGSLPAFFFFLSLRVAEKLVLSIVSLRPSSPSDCCTWTACRGAGRISAQRDMLFGQQEETGQSSSKEHRACWPYSSFYSHIQRILARTFRLSSSASLPGSTGTTACCWPSLSGVLVLVLDQCYQFCFGFFVFVNQDPASQDGGRWKPTQSQEEAKSKPRVRATSPSWVSSFL